MGRPLETDPGSIDVEVENHTSFAARTGLVGVGGSTLTVRQAGVCDPTVHPLERAVAAGAGENFVDVSTGEACAWTAESHAAFVHLLPYTGLGPDRLRFAYDANVTGSPRVGTLTVAGQTVTVTQLAATDPAGEFDPSRDVVRFYHTDAIGSVRMITDATGQVRERFDYLPFGEVFPASAAFRDPRMFAGHESDRELGLEYFGARYYASANGRFTTVDPFLDVDNVLVNPQLWNRYAYGLNNPLTFTDPDGRNPLLIIPILYGLYELGSTAYDAYTTYQTFRDPNATATERVVTGGGLLLGAIAPGGGYATGGRALFRSSLELGHHINAIELKITRILQRDLDSATIEAAVRELRGDVVAIKPSTAAAFDHIQKVREAAQGLRNQTDEIKNILRSPDLTRKTRSLLETQLRRARDKLEELEAYGLAQ